ncbi:hypothetical protein AB0M95_01995 [Sphaerisporangium sp. NPDC051017]|uniref:hypothetical protein n=1 Tax=Sphaerisporangium sp. NPDC051017 TaxID=3154636 RepID=UPI003436FA38
MTANRSLRLSVPAETFAAVETYAKWLDMSIAKTAAFMLAFGLAAAEAYAERQLDAEDAKTANPSGATPTAPGSTLNGAQ